MRLFVPILAFVGDFPQRTNRLNFDSSLKYVRVFFMFAGNQYLLLKISRNMPINHFNLNNAWNIPGSNLLLFWSDVQLFLDSIDYTDSGEKTPIWPCRFSSNATRCHLDYPAVQHVTYAGDANCVSTATCVFAYAGSELIIAIWLTGTKQ